MQKVITPFIISLASILFLFAKPVFAGDIIGRWNKVTIPVAPKLQPVTVDHSSTSLLILDIEDHTCNLKRHPRCLDTVPHIASLLEQATLINLITSPGTRKNTTLTRLSMITIE